MLPSESVFDHLRFDPTQGTVIRDPPGVGYGYWTGGHKVSFDKQSNQFVLFYRERTPLEKGRGGRCALATSTDGIEFTDVWSATKDEFAASSIEVGHCVRGLDGRWKFYVSYEVEGARYWRIDLLEGEELDSISVQGRRTVFQPQAFGQRSLKDPVVYVSDSEYFVFVAGGSRSAPRQDGDTTYVGGGDATFLASSSDGKYFTSIRRVFEPPNSDTWHGRRARINSVIKENDGWLALYDGGRGFYDTYEEWCGLAWSEDGIKYERLAQDRPWVRSPFGCVRYVYAQDAGEQLYFYYEYTREDGSHDLRVSVVNRR